MRAVRPLIQNALVRAPNIQPVINNNRPVLETSIGGFLGKRIKISDGQQICAFLNVPFAEPPLGYLRFEAPLAPKYVPLREATKMPEASHKTEDCLYLNLFVPNEPSSDPNGYPLLIFIPGGGFDKTTCSPHSTPYMAENYCRRGIAYACIQYRVGVFGFGSDESSNFPGNYALADICQALLFIHENAQQIGIDPGKITISGHSAGAAMVSALSVSPKSRDLFSNVIQFSGCSVSSIATGNIVKSETRKIVDKLNGTGIPITNSKNFLMQFEAKDIFRAYKEIGPPTHGTNVLRFSPRIDGDIIPKDYFDLIQESPPKPTLNTNSFNEGVIFALYNYLESIAEVRNSDISIFDANKFRQQVRDLLISGPIRSDLKPLGVEEVFKFYAKNCQNQDPVFYLNAYTRAIHDCYFGVPAKIEMCEKVKCGWPVFNAIFERLHPAVYPPNVPLKVPTHGSEYIYLFGHLKNSEELFDEADIKYRDFWIESIVDFVKTGNPGSKNSHWKRATIENPGTTLRVQSEQTIFEDAFLDEELSFWKKLNKLCDYNIVRQMPL